MRYFVFLSLLSLVFGSYSSMLVGSECNGIPLVVDSVLSGTCFAEFTDASFLPLRYSNCTDSTMFVSFKNSSVVDCTSPDYSFSMTESSDCFTSPFTYAPNQYYVATMGACSDEAAGAPDTWQVMNYYENSDCSGNLLARYSYNPDHCQYNDTSSSFKWYCEDGTAYIEIWSSTDCTGNSNKAVDSTNNQCLDAIQWTCGADGPILYGNASILIPSLSLFVSLLYLFLN